MTLEGKIRPQKVLISRCLLGEPVRYDGTGVKCDNPIIEKWRVEDRVVTICPELEGGCPVPRLPAEISGGDGSAVLTGQAHIVEIHGQDVTQQYLQGAYKALQIAQENSVKFAVLKARSPSCGNKFIYDGSFSSTLKLGMGVTAALLEQEGIRVFNEEEIHEAEIFLLCLETP